MSGVLVPDLVLWQRLVGHKGTTRSVRSVLV